MGASQDGVDPEIQRGQPVKSDMERLTAWANSQGLRVTVGRVGPAYARGEWSVMVSIARPVRYEAEGRGGTPDSAARVIIQDLSKLGVLIP